MKRPSIAIVHEWLEAYGGSELVLAQIQACFPEADLFVVVDHMPEWVRLELGIRPTKRCSLIQHLPGSQSQFRRYLPMMPWAMKQLDLRQYGLIISNSHAVAKYVRLRSDQIHICYCHSPMRYVWDLSADYLRLAGLANGAIHRLACTVQARLRRWDRRSARPVHRFLCNSHYIAHRIRRCYDRSATVIHPPIALDQFTICERPREKWYLYASRLVPYKRADLVIDTFNQLSTRKLLIVGTGPEEDRLRQRAQSNIEFLGHVEKLVLVDLLQRCRGFIFPPLEDFGLMPLEAQACGTPVIAYGAGGSLETVCDGTTGLHFSSQTTNSLQDAITRFEHKKWDPIACRQHAERFSASAFRAGIIQAVHETLSQPHGWR